MTLEYHSDFVTVTVKDQGVGFSFADVPPAGTARADFGGGKRLGGFGMQMIHSLSDNLVFHRTDPHGTTVCAEKKLYYRSENAASAAALLNNADGEAHITLEQSITEDKRPGLLYN